MGSRIGTLEEEASKESSSLSLERAMRILESGRREEEGMVASKNVVVVDGAIVHRVGERDEVDGDGDGDQLGSITENRLLELSRRRQLHQHLTLVRQPN